MSTDRTPGGEPLPGTQIVLTDAVAYLSGVNYGSVVKVIAAINAVATLLYTEHYDDLLRACVSPGEELEKTLLSFDAVPTTPVTPQDPECRTRLRETDKFVRYLVRGGYADPYEVLDKSTEKFR